MKSKSVLFFLLFVSTLSFAQVRMGVSAGGNLMTQKFSPKLKDDKISNLFTWHAGILFSIPLIKGLSVQPGLNYQLKGCKKESTDSKAYNVLGVVYSVDYNITQNFKFHYIELPLTLSYAFERGTLKIAPYAGMYVSYALSANAKKTTASSEVKAAGYTIMASETTTITEDFKFKKDDDPNVLTVNQLDYGSQFGVGFEYDKIFLRLQYSLGFADIYRVEKQASANNGLGLSIGYWINDSSGGNSNRGTSFKGRSKSKKSKYSHRPRKYSR